MTSANLKSLVVLLSSDIDDICPYISVVVVILILSHHYLSHLIFELNIEILLVTDTNKL